MRKNPKLKITGLDSDGISAVHICETRRNGNISTFNTETGGGGSARSRNSCKKML